MFIDRNRFCRILTRGFGLILLRYFLDAVWGWRFSRAPQSGGGQPGTAFVPRTQGALDGVLTALAPEIPVEQLHHIAGA